MHSLNEQKLQTPEGARIVCRIMQPEDVPAVVAMEQRIFTDPWTEQGFLDELKQSYALYLTVVCQNPLRAADAAETAEAVGAEAAGSQIVGYCGLVQSFEEAEITNVAVSPDLRRQGIGLAMLKELMRLGKERGITRFILEVRAGNAGAISLYQKLGFQMAGIRKNFYTQPLEDGLTMVRECTDEAEEG